MIEPHSNARDPFLLCQLPNRLLAGILLPPDDTGSDDVGHPNRLPLRLPDDAGGGDGAARTPNEPPKVGGGGGGDGDAAWNSTLACTSFLRVKGCDIDMVVRGTCGARYYAHDSSQN